MHHPCLTGLARLPVVPSVLAIRYDSVAIGNKSFNDDSPIVANLAESHKYVLYNRLRADAGSGQREAIRLGPEYFISNSGCNCRNVA